MALDYRLPRPGVVEPAEGDGVTPRSCPQRRASNAKNSVPAYLGASGLIFDVPRYVTFAPANLTTLPHFSVSSATSLPNSPGEPGSSVAPSSANRACALGSARIAL